MINPLLRKMESLHWFSMSVTTVYLEQLLNFYHNVLRSFCCVCIMTESDGSGTFPSTHRFCRYVDSEPWIATHNFLSIMCCDQHMYLYIFCMFESKVNYPKVLWYYFLSMIYFLHYISQNFSLTHLNFNFDNLLVFLDYCCFQIQG
jgi:hypothetical protein